MPVFHTKTMEMILEPVAQQVAQLVVMHEDAEDGNPMPDLAQPVQSVRSAVEKLIQVGYQTLNHSQDVILKHDMPPALNRVEEASLELVKATEMLRSDPLSDPARKKLIEGSRGILQGTSGLLLAFDESEVRKIVKCCKAVLEYLAIAEVVDDMTDLVTYIEKLTPGLTDMTKQVDAREKELTHAVHRQWLTRSLQQIKSLVPVLITSMKAYVTTRQPESIANRDFVVKKIADEIDEIIRVLQLTTYDEEEWDADDVTVMKKALNSIENKMVSAHGWLSNPTAPVGGSGVTSVKEIIKYARKVADLCNNPADQERLTKLAGDVESLFSALCELRDKGMGTSPQAQSLQGEIQARLKEIQAKAQSAVASTERSGTNRPAPTIAGKVEQALRWLANPSRPDAGLGEQATRLVVAEGRKAAQTCSGEQRAELLRLCDDIEASTHRLKGFMARGMGSSPDAVAISQDICQRLPYLQKKIEDALCNKVVEDFIDTSTPLKQLSDAAFAPANTPNRDQNFEEKGNYFIAHANTLSDTAMAVAVTMSSGHRSKANVEALLKSAQDAKDLAPQIRSAARIVLKNPGQQAAADNFTSLKTQWVDNMDTLRTLVDDATDTVTFIKSSEEAIRKDTDRVEDGIKTNDSSKVVGNSASIARRANRVTQVAQREAENSEDPMYVQRVTDASANLSNTIPPLVTSSKDLALNTQNPQAAAMWRKNNQNLIDGVVGVRQAVTLAHPDSFPPPPDLSQLHITAEPYPSPPPRLHQTAPPPVFKKPTAPAKSQTSRIFREIPMEQLNRVHMAPSASEPLSHFHPVPVETDFMLNNVQPKMEVVDNMTQKQQEQSLRTAAPCPPPPPPPVPPPPQDTFYSTYYGGESAPPRPPPPAMRAPPETDDEDEAFFPIPQANQPIMVAAHDLHMEAKQWSSKDNEIIAAAKKMAILMANLSMIVRGEGGSKKELIDTAKKIVEASKEVTKAARKLSHECTDKRVRLALLQVCERIPTIGTQLKILSTVKATMLGAQGTDEDQEATEMLVGNAQNLMQSVKETVRAAEAASIRIRVDSGYSIRWLRRKPWYS